MVATATTTYQTAEYLRPKLYPLQQAAIFDPARYAVIEASTKSGKTTGCLAWLVEQAVRGHAGWNYWWVAPIYGQARIAYRRMKRGLPLWAYTSNESELTITLRNGAVIWFKGSENPDSLYGEDVYAAVIDEASRVKEASFFAVRSTLTATRGPVRIIGNVKGRKNWAYRLARRAETGEPDTAYYRITAADAVAAGVLDAAEIEDARRVLPEHVFRELYDAEASDDEGNPFGVAHIQACIAPLSGLPPARWGVDLAKSVDYTVALALDTGGHTTRFERFQGPWEVTNTRVQSLVGTTPALVDSTGVGDPILERLQAAQPRTYEGYHFSQQSKQKLMEGLTVAIQQREITYPDGPIVIELQSFEYQYTRSGVRYAAMAGMHDDCVMALGLAWSHHQHHRPSEWGAV